MNYPKHVEFYSKNKSEKLSDLVGFTIRICHDSRSPERHKPHSIVTDTKTSYFTKFLLDFNIMFTAYYIFILSPIVVFSALNICLSVSISFIIGLSHASIVDNPYWSPLLYWGQITRAILLFLARLLPLSQCCVTYLFVAAKAIKTLTTDTDNVNLPA